MNSGFEESWVWKVRESVRVDPAWHFSRLEGPEASWIPAARLEEQRRILPGVVFSRLWENRWSGSAGDALRPEDIAAALTLPGPPKGPEAGYFFYTGVDLSVSRDHSSLVTIGKHHSGRVRLMDIRDWNPQDSGGRVDLAEIEDVCWELHRRYHPRFLCDPYQCEMLSQRLRTRGALVEMVPFVGKSLLGMASAVVEAFANRTVDLFRDERLVGDLRKLRIKESPSGWRLDAPRTSTGHCDRATAFALAMLGSRQGYVPPPIDWDQACPVVLTGARVDPVSATFFGDPAGAPFLEGRGRNRTGALDGPPPRVWKDWDL
jgi:hypothetical protein